MIDYMKFWAAKFAFDVLIIVGIFALILAFGFIGRVVEAFRNDRKKA